MTCWRGLARAHTARHAMVATHSDPSYVRISLNDLVFQRTIDLVFVRIAFEQPHRDSKSL